MTNEEYLKKAVSLLNDYCEREFGEKAKLSDLNNIPIMYTTHDDCELQVVVKLLDQNFIYIVNGYWLKVQFRTVEEMLTDLEWMTFDELYGECLDVAIKFGVIKED